MRRRRAIRDADSYSDLFMSRGLSVPNSVPAEIGRASCRERV